MKKFIFSVIASTLIIGSASADVKFYPNDKMELNDLKKNFSEFLSYYDSYKAEMFDFVMSTNYDNLITLRFNTDKVKTNQPVFTYMINEKLVTLGDILMKSGNHVKPYNSEALGKINIEALNSYLTSSIKANKTVDYESDNELTTVYIFTDPTCPYCTNLHKEVDSLNKSGVSVKYIPYSRTFRGDLEPINNGTSFIQLSNALCDSDGGKNILNKYFKESSIRNGKETHLDDMRSIDPYDFTLCNSVVAAGHQLGNDVGLTGTPGILLANGSFISGYVPYNDMMNILKAENLLNDNKDIK